MNGEFIEGFVKAAVAQGLTDDTIARIFKRAMANPKVAGMLKQLPSATPQPPAPPQPSAPPPQPNILAQTQQMGKNPQITAAVQQLAKNPQQMAMFHQALLQKLQGQLGQPPAPTV